MDSWSEKQIEFMRLGGNKNLGDWFKKYNVGGTIQEKYHTPAAVSLLEHWEFCYF